MFDRFYNRIAGRSVDRLAALSDGVFSVAMTLLVLDLHVPEVAKIIDEDGLRAALLALAPHFVTYGMSFMTAGIFWVGQTTQFDYFRRGDRNLTWIMVAFLFGISVLPFSTDLLAEFTTFRFALGSYWLNILYLGAMLYASIAYASHAKLVRDGAGDAVRQIKKRIVVAQALYAASAVCCLISTYLSIALIVSIQLYYVIAPNAQVHQHEDDALEVTPEEAASAALSSPVAAAAVVVAAPPAPVPQPPAGGGVAPEAATP